MVIFKLNKNQIILQKEIVLIILQIFFKEHNIIVIADNCCDNTLNYITQILNEKEIKHTIIPTNFGNGAASFRKCITTSLNMETILKI